MMDTYHRWMEVTAPGTLLSCPIINLPVGFNSRGLPMGMQIIGQAKQDLDVLKLANAYDMKRWLSGPKKVPLFETWLFQCGLKPFNRNLPWPKRMGKPNLRILGYPSKPALFNRLTKLGFRLCFSRRLDNFSWKSLSLLVFVPKSRRSTRSLTAES